MQYVMQHARGPWLPRRRRELDGTDASLALPPGPVSNGEFIPAPATGRDRAIERSTRLLVDEAARRAGLDRRQFLQTAGGVAASLAVFNVAACAKRTGRPAPTTPAGAGTPAPTTSAQPGGTFAVPPPEDTVACAHALGGNGEFIFDVHTHHVMPDGPWRHSAPETVGLVLGMAPACGSADRLVCVDRAAYLHDLFLASDTTVAMLSDVPNSGPGDAPVPFPDMLGTQELATQLGGPGASRLLVQNVIAPNVGDLHARLDGMTAAAHSGQVAAFKVYTAWSPTGPGWSLADPALGLPVVQHAHDLGVKVFVAHKGLPLVHFDPSHNKPDDIVAVSRQFPDMQFVVFHGAWDPNHREGPYAANATLGIDTFLAALDRHQVPVNDNVWVDLGTVWRQLLTDPTQAAHVVGKLLKRVGEDRVLWGTDAIWYGSPQPQIMAMRTFAISNEYQDRFGYPALTAARKAKIFGLNAANLFGVDVGAVRCTLASDPLQSGQAQAAAMRADGALASAWLPRGPTSRRDMLRWLAAEGSRWIPT